MNKHINSFNNLQDFNNNIDTVESPSVSYIKDKDDVVIKGMYHDPTEDKTKAQVGDIVFFNDMIYNDDIEGDKILYMDPRDPRLSMMFENDTCYGVVVIPASHTEDGTVRVVSLQYMDYNNPSDGNSTAVQMMWGEYDVDVQGITNVDKIAAYVPGSTTISLLDYSYFATDYNLITATSGIPDKRENYDFLATNNSMVPTPYAADGTQNTVYTSTEGSVLTQGLNGKANTLAIVDKISFTPGDTITNTQADYPAACCCVSFMNSDEDIQTAGGYYLPSIAELGYLAANFEEVDFARRAAGYDGLTNKYFWSSSCYSSNYAWYVDFGLRNYFGYCNYGTKGTRTSVLAFVAF